MSPFSTVLLTSGLGPTAGTTAVPDGGRRHPFLVGTKTDFRKAFLALSRDVGTVRVHRDSTALCRCKSGTGPTPCITSASSSIVVVIAALDYIMCSLSRDNDDAHARCALFISCFASPVRILD